jgi:hypothetical protein
MNGSFLKILILVTALSASASGWASAQSKAGAAMGGTARGAMRSAAMPEVAMRREATLWLDAVMPSS